MDDSYKNIGEYIANKKCKLFNRFWWYDCWYGY